MASISPSPPHNFSLSNSKFLSSYGLKGPTSPSSATHFPSHSPYQTHTICRCNNSDSPSPSDPSTPRQWHSALQDLVHTAIKTFDSLMNPRKSDSKEALHCDDGLHTENQAKEDLGGNKDDRDWDWDWDRWRKHFQEVDEQERLLAVLKSQLSRAVRTEDYQYAARTKVAIAALSTKDTVGQVRSYLNKAIEEERYHDAAFIRDKAGAGLVGWWSGIPNNVKDPRGLIIRITAEHGRYVARSYSPRQLTTATGGIPLFEIFLNVNEKGEYKQQAVYLKWGGAFQVSSADSSKVSDGPSLLSSSDPNEDKGELFVSSSEDVEDVDDRGEDSDLALGLTGFQNLLRDVIPGVKVKVLKMTTPGKVDKDLISKVIEQIIEEEEEEEEEGGGEEDDENGGGEEDKIGDLEILDVENKIQDDDQLRDAINLDSDPGIIENEVHNGIAVKVVVGGLVQKLSGRVPSEDFLRVPAKIEKKDRHTFSFSIEEDDNKQDSEGKKRSPVSKRSKLQNESGIEHIMVDLAKFVGREKIPLKVFKEVGELIKLTLSQAQNHEPLVGTTIFNRIEINASSEPLNGLYIGAHGLYTSEVIHLKQRFGRWKEDRGGQETSNLEFYEYVEAFKITGDPYIPAGQVAFRAKVGKRYQIPHKGIIPEEFGVIARYKGQGRLAEPGFQNPRWVDGELVILDGKYIKGGPVVGFVYWAPEFHFLVFFNRLKLPQ